MGAGEELSPKSEWFLEKSKQKIVVYSLVRGNFKKVQKKLRKINS